MLSSIPAVCLLSTPALEECSAELVNKIETSTAFKNKKRRYKAAKKLARVIKEQRRMAKSNKNIAVALTLTYRNSKDFSPKNISKFLDNIRRKLKRAGHSFAYAWVLECASHLHYHLILWLPRDFTLGFSTLSKWWPWGSTWIKSCRDVNAWAKYLSKLDGITNLPRGARAFNYGGLDEAGKIAVARTALPIWLLKLLPKNMCARRCAGGGWINMATGEIFHSPYIWTPLSIRLRAELIHFS